MSSGRGKVLSRERTAGIYIIYQALATWGNVEEGSSERGDFTLWRVWRRREMFKVMNVPPSCDRGEV